MAYYCPNCKNLVKKGMRYCIECGYKLEWPDSDPSDSNTSDSNPSGANPSGSNSSDSNTSNHKPSDSSDLNPSDVDTTDSNPSDSNPTGSNLSSSNHSDSNPSDFVPSDHNPFDSINLLKMHSIEKEKPIHTSKSFEKNKYLQNLKNLEDNRSLEKNKILNNIEPLNNDFDLNQSEQVSSDLNSNEKNTDKALHEDENDSEKKQIEISISNIALRLGIISVLILLLSFIWWIFMLNGVFTSSKDFNLLMIFCTPGLLFAIAAIVLGEIDITRTISGRTEKIYLKESVNGILLGAITIGIVLTLVLVRWISF